MKYGHGVENAETISVKALYRWSGFCREAVWWTTRWGVVTTLCATR